MGHLLAKETGADPKCRAGRKRVANASRLWTSSRVALAALLTRPQADLQIGAPQA
jgi:hypothetical protein